MKRLITLTFSCFVLLTASAFAQKTDTTKKAKAKMATAKMATTTKMTAAKPAAAVTEGVNKSADKAIGKDAKGRTIYLGPKGGQYTLSEAGKKSYIKTADKIKVN